MYDLVRYVQTNGKSRVTPQNTASRALGIKPYSTATEEAFLTTLNHALDNIWLSQNRFSVEKEVAVSQVFEDNLSLSDLFYTGRFDFVVYERSSANIRSWSLSWTAGNTMKMKLSWPGTAKRRKFAGPMTWNSSGWKIPMPDDISTSKGFWKLILRPPDNLRSGEIFYNFDIFSGMVGDIAALPVGSHKIHGRAGFSYGEAGQLFAGGEVF